MKVFIVHNEKGGVGKTLITSHIAWYFSEKGKRVLFLDADMQGNGTRMLSAADTYSYASAFFTGSLPDEAPNGSFVVVPSDSVLATNSFTKEDHRAGLKRSIETVAPHFDICVVDTNPFVGQPLVSLFCLATHSLSPIDLSEHSVQGVQSVLNRIIRLKQSGLNADLRFLGIVLNHYDKSKPSQKAILDRLLSTYSTKYFVPNPISYREAFNATATSCMPVWRGYD